MHSKGESPRRIPPILIPARQTEAMIMTLKNTPRYIALKALKNTASLPLYLNS